MNTLFKASFRKYVKKQSRSFQLAIEDEVECIVSAPDKGENKSGDLIGFKVYKFIFNKQQFLIAYMIQGNKIIFYGIGTHENFYRELKKYLKEAKSWK